MATRNRDTQPETVTEEIGQAEEIRPAELPDEKDEIIKALQAQLAEMKKAAGKAEEPQEKPAGTEGSVWDEFIDVVVPRHGRGQEKFFYVSVNGRNAQIPADGKMHHIRKPLALALLAGLEDEAKAEQFAEDLPHDAAPASFGELMAVINDLKSKLRMGGISV